ncbi:PRC-barrel domain-containing protein [Loktanella sp. M215]|uniref:PRC-barrel domain-containing protein n=1 Tax=Loktanella sp. M215 TaxID=2675431 RepID=UPI001F3F12B6|nr:PRC-barrel domain-containing protein [Loktanella sp. M215]
MKKILATTAIALVMANGAFAESHMNADGTPKDAATSTDTMAPAADSTTSTDTMAPAADSTMTTDTTTAPADTSTGMAMDSTATAPTMTMDGYDTVMNADVTTDALTGTEVYGPDDKEVGEIGDLVMGADGTVTDVIVDVGGFLGLGEKPVSIAFDSVQIMKQTDGDDMRAYVSMTEDQLKELPKYEAPADAAATDTMPAATDGTAPAADGTAPAADGTAPAANN